MEVAMKRRFKITLYNLIKSSKFRFKNGYPEHILFDYFDKICPSSDADLQIMYPDDCYLAFLFILTTLIILDSI